MTRLQRNLGYLSSLLLLICLARPDAAAAQSGADWAQLRNRMVDSEVVAAGVKNQRVVAAMRTTPRHEFVPAPLRKNAYFDMAMPIGSGQTISPPFVVAYMTEQLDPQPADKVLEIGTGSGYQAAVLAELVAEVYSIEIQEPLGKKAAETIKRLKYHNITSKIGDGYQGWAEHAPFDKIIVTCSPEDIPKPLVEQLREGGRMVIPLGERYQQTLYLYRKVDGELKAEALQPTFFVPMTGRAEELRVVHNDDGRPTLTNGGFEEAGTDGQPANWYYVRQAKLSDQPPAAEGTHYCVFTNQTPGRGSQALQAIGVDGRRVTEINVSLSVRARDVRPGPNSHHRPRMVITFFDEGRKPVGMRELGPWTGSFDWADKQAKIKIPATARLGVIAVGLMGATGEIALDDLRIDSVSMPEAATDAKPTAQ